MARCISCDYPLPDDRERMGARCPNCRDPLYEPAGRTGRSARPGEASCPVHEGMESVGVCLRCGEHLCEVCRTRWRGQVVCAVCIDHALTTREATPEQARAHGRQARLALALGGAAWLLSAAALGVLQLAGKSAPALLTFAAFLIVAANVLTAALGVGQAVAALRTGGENTLKAAAGLLLGTVYVGGLLGAGMVFLWQS